jgi:hypothetical protein
LGLAGREETSLMRRMLVPLLSLLLLAVPVLGPATTAQAHYSRTLGGKYQAEVGFRNEPPLAGQLNAAQIQVSVPAEGNRPVEGLEKTLQAEVIVGGNAKSLALSLEAVADQPGTYVGYFIPTREGSYIFHFFGQIENLPIDERFESGPGRFDDVTAAQGLQFPDKLPSPGQSAAELSAALAAAETATTLAVVGIVVGMLGLGLAVFALRRRTGKKEQGQTV